MAHEQCEIETQSQLIYLGVHTSNQKLRSFMFSFFKQIINADNLIS
jgi:hypothetical protein